MHEFHELDKYTQLDEEDAEQFLIRQAEAREQKRVEDIQRKHNIKKKSWAGGIP